MNFFSYNSASENKQIDAPDDLSLLADDEPGNQPQIGSMVQQNKIDINSAVSSVVQLDDDSGDEVESINFQIQLSQKAAVNKATSSPNTTNQNAQKTLMPISSACSLLQVSQDQSLVLQSKIETLKAMEIQNRALKIQMQNTKSILTRMEEQMVKQHETQLDQMFQMQENNEELQRDMASCKEENQLLREYLADLEQELAAKESVSKAPMMGRQASRGRSSRGRSNSTASRNNE